MVRITDQQVYEWDAALRDMEGSHRPTVTGRGPTESAENG